MLPHTENQNSQFKKIDKKYKFGIMAKQSLYEMSIFRYQLANYEVVVIKKIRSGIDFYCQDMVTRPNKICGLKNAPKIQNF